MIGKSYSAAIIGTRAELIEVEADIAPGLPSFDMTGNLGATAKEAKERVRTALRNSDIHLNPSRITVNMSPANLRKEGPHFDLSVAISLLCAIGYIETTAIKGMIFVGELSLDGRVNPVKAVLPMTICALENQFTHIVVPYDNCKEAACIKGINVIGITSLNQCIDWIKGNLPIEPTIKENTSTEKSSDFDFSDIKGQTVLKRAAMVAAASMHNMLIFGPPGTGKSMVAMRVPDILPDLSFEESLDISKIYSISGLLNNENSIITSRPFRRPHYTITKAAFCGGGINPTPGELSLASRGVLFLDELNLFSKDVLESLRVPLETGEVSIVRNSAECVYPADFMMVGAMNPCKCGYYPDRSKCKCSEMDVKRHLGKISKPIMDRIDIYVNATRVTYSEINNNDADIYTTIYMKKKVRNAVKIQNKRYKEQNFSFNSQIPANQIKAFCKMSEEAERIIERVYDNYDLSARSYNKILKVARTIADIEEHEYIELSDISEAISYKAMEV